MTGMGFKQAAYLILVALIFYAALSAGGG